MNSQTYSSAVGIFFGDPYREGRIKRGLRKLFSPRVGHLGSAASTPDRRDLHPPVSPQKRSRKRR